MRPVAVVALALAMLLSFPRTVDAAPPDYYPPLQWSPANAANFDAGRAGRRITTIVIHATGGSYAGALAWFQNPSAKLSAHYVVRASDGEITQTVSEKDTAFHARGVNRSSIGIEHEFDPARGIGYTDAQYRSSARLACSIARRYGIPVDRAHIIGHSEVTGTDHSDPGQTWDWARYMALVRGCGQTATVSSVTDGTCNAAVCAPRAGLRLGDSGTRVEDLQVALVYLGRLREADMATGPGLFGPRTLAALVAFQRDAALPTTGFYGDLSAGALAQAIAQRPPEAPAADLAIGDDSTDVAQLQRVLGARGYMSVVTGYFGPVTRAALVAFQRDHGIPATGAYGPLTRRALALH